MTGRKEESHGEIVLYQAPDGKVELNVRLDRDSLWLSQKKKSLLFDKDADTISLHLRNIYKEAELVKLAITEESSVVQMEGNKLASVFLGRIRGERSETTASQTKTRNRK